MYRIIVFILFLSPLKKPVSQHCLQAREPSMGSISDYTHIPQGRAKGGSDGSKGSHSRILGGDAHRVRESPPEIPMVPWDHAPFVETHCCGEKEFPESSEAEQQSVTTFIEHSWCTEYWAEHWKEIQWQFNSYCRSPQDYVLGEWRR